MSGTHPRLKRHITARYGSIPCVGGHLCTSYSSSFGPERARGRGQGVVDPPEQVERDACARKGRKDPTRCGLGLGPGGGGGASQTHITSAPASASVPFRLGITSQHRRRRLYLSTDLN